MKMGLLWYDGDPKRALECKIDQAMERYLARFGEEPDTCHLNPSQVCKHQKVNVVANHLIRPNHVWVGLDEQKPA